MKRIFIFDADEVVLKREMYFSRRLARDFEIPEEEIMKFFKKEYKDCAIGKSDLRNVLKKYIENWGWSGSVQDLMKYWFENEREINGAVVNEIKNLRRKGYTCCLATNNEIYRTQYLLNEVGLKDLFDYVFSSSEVGFLKSAGEFWKFVQERIGVNDPGNIVVWDSDRKNIKKVNELGMKGFIFTDEETFLMDINEMLDPKKMEHDKRKIA
jgi:putative hydrolase of the HAD superfamily